MGDFFSANRLSFPNFVLKLSLNPEKTEKKKARIKWAVKDTEGYKSRRAAGPLCACRIRRTLSWLPFYSFRIEDTLT
jgi:hypothetical protein